MGTRGTEGTLGTRGTGGTMGTLGTTTNIYLIVFCFLLMRFMIYDFLHEGIYPFDLWHDFV